MIRFTDNHAKRLARMSPQRIIPAMGDVLEAGARAIAEDAAESIRHGAISGSGHIPSAPFEAPNADTHDLDESIRAGELIETFDSIRTAAIADSDHAWIERGGANMFPRPYMEPAAERHRDSTVAALRRRFGREVLT